MVTGLKDGTKYYFAVRALNAVGPSKPSKLASATPATTSSAPQSLTAAAGNTTVTLTWSKPVSNGGSAITGYDVYDGATESTVTKLVNAKPLSASTLRFTVVGLKNGTKYYFAVKAINAVGASKYSNVVGAAPAKAGGLAPFSVRRAGRRRWPYFRAL